MDAMWRQLSTIAVAEETCIAQRCAQPWRCSHVPILGDAKEIKFNAERDLGFRGSDHYMVDRRWLFSIRTQGAKSSY